MNCLRFIPVSAAFACLFLSLSLSLGGCASYLTPGGPAPLARLQDEGASAAQGKTPSPHFPASLAVVRVQAPEYRSDPGEARRDGGRFSVLAAVNSLPTPDGLRQMATWPGVATIAVLDPAKLPEKFGAPADLRLAAAKVDADVLLIYTVDTAFRIGGRVSGRATPVPVGSRTLPADTAITTTASALFADVRTGALYGTATASATAADSELDGAFASFETLDRKRREVERRALASLLDDAAKTWQDIAYRFQ